MSLKTRMEGSTGKIHSFWAMYSLRMSFWFVPPSSSGETPCFSAATTYMARSTCAGALMVMEVVISPIGIPLKSRSMSSRESTATPSTPTSPKDMDESESRPMRVGMSKATERPFWPCSRRYLNRLLVSSAEPKPANCLIVLRRVERLYRHAGHCRELYVVPLFPLGVRLSPALPCRPLLGVQNARILLCFRRSPAHAPGPCP